MCCESVHHGTHCVQPHSRPRSSQSCKPLCSVLHARRLPSPPQHARVRNAPAARRRAAANALGDARAGAGDEGAGARRAGRPAAGRQAQDGAPAARAGRLERAGRPVGGAGRRAGAGRGAPGRAGRRAACAASAVPGAAFGAGQGLKPNPSLPPYPLALFQAQRVPLRPGRAPLAEAAGLAAARHLAVAGAALRVLLSLCAT
jgi:hypothetical protein